MARSDIDLVITKSKQLEQALQDKFGANGRGLHEKVASVESQLDTALVKKLRWIATLRNKVVHEEFELPSQTEYTAACDDALKKISALPHTLAIINNSSRPAQRQRPAGQPRRRGPSRQSRSTGNSPFVWIVIVVVLIIGVSMFMGKN